MRIDIRESCSHRMYHVWTHYPYRTRVHITYAYSTHIAHVCVTRITSSSQRMRCRHIVHTIYAPYVYTYVCSICIRVVAHMHVHVCISHMWRRHMVHTIYAAYVYICMHYMYTRRRTYPRARVHITYRAVVT